MTPKTLLVGWDSASWDYLDPLLEKGELPNLQGLVDAGCRGTLQSTVPPITPAAWSSIITGKLPHKHGVYDWVWDSADRLQAASSADLTGTPFWRRLNDQGIRVGLVNVPLTFPVSPIEGFVLCGFGAPQPPAELAYPAGLLREIEDRFGSYTPVLPPECVQNHQRSEDHHALYSAEVQVQAMHVQAALYAAEKYGVGVLAINLMLFDHTNHRAPDLAQVESSLRETDQQLGLLMDGFAPDAVVLFSDHGARRFKGLFLLGDWLCERGYMVRRRKRNQTVQELNYLLRQYLDHGLGLTGLFEKSVRRTLRGTVPHLPVGVGTAFWRDVQRRVPRAYAHYWFDPVETDPETSFVSRALNAGTIYFAKNVSALHSDLTGDLAKLRLLDELGGVRDPETSQPVFRRLLERADLYGSEPPGSPPDLFVDYYGSEFGLRTAMGTGLELRYPHFAYMADNPQVSLTWYGDHDHEGVYVFSGPGFQQGTASEPGCVVDVPATLLHLLQIPIPDDFDGQVLTSAFVEDRPVLSQPGDPALPRDSRESEYSESEGGQVLSHLRALGYVD
jgi:predicted AlkP superfamily phosphohydrolase/phosphomutase